MDGEVFITQEDLPAGKSRCPECREIHDIHSNTIADRAHSEDEEIFREMIDEMAGKMQAVHLRCPKCGTTYELTRKSVSATEQKKGGLARILKALGAPFPKKPIDPALEQAFLDAYADGLAVAGVLAEGFEHDRNFMDKMQQAGRTWFEGRLASNLNDAGWDVMYGSPFSNRKVKKLAAAMDRKLSKDPETQARFLMILGEKTQACREAKSRIGEDEQETSHSD